MAAGWPVGVDAATLAADSGDRAEAGSDAVPAERWYLEVASYVSRRGVAGSCLF